MFVTHVALEDLFPYIPYGFGLLFAAPLALFSGNRSEPWRLRMRIAFGICLAIWLLIFVKLNVFRVPLILTAPLFFALRKWRFSPTPRVREGSEIYLTVATALFGVGCLQFWSVLLFSAEMNVELLDSSVSPDGRWRAEVIEHGGIAYCVDELQLVSTESSLFGLLPPKTLSLGEFAIEGDYKKMEWRSGNELHIRLSDRAEFAPMFHSNGGVQVFYYAPAVSLSRSSEFATP